MKHIDFSYEKTALIAHDKLQELALCVRGEIDRVRHMLETGYATEYASVNVPADTNSLHEIKQVIAEKLVLNPAIIVLVGIGGSSLGAQALIQALFGVYYFNQPTGRQIYCVDTVDAHTVQTVLTKVQNALNNQQKVLIIIATKSGTTIETVASGALFIDLLYTYYTDAHDYIIALTDKNSPLYMRAQQLRWTILEIPPLVGGRFSVLTAMGLLPLGLLGGDIAAMRTGAQHMLLRCLNTTIDQNPAALSALLLYSWYQAGKTIHDMFLFSPVLENLGKWYRQLIGESIGKQYTCTQKLIEIGITPTVSIGTTDLHSVAQLYLGGPRDKATTFVYVEKPRAFITVPEGPLTPVGSLVQGHSLHHIISATFQGTCAAYVQDQRPFAVITLPDISEYILGEFMQFKMLEIIYLAALWAINPFDQPNVERYKQATRAILESEN